MRTKTILRICLMLAIALTSQLFTVNAGTRPRQAPTTPSILYTTEHSVVVVEFGNDTVATTEITAFNDSIKCTEWSDDGQWLILGRDSGIYRMHSQTYEVETLVDQQDIGAEERFLMWCPLFSPDKQWLAFRTLHPDHNAALYTMSHDGSQLTQLIESMALGTDWAGPIDWSYDSQWMIFYAGIEDQFGKWRMHPDGSQRETLHMSTTGEIDDSLELEMRASWSPDQDKIAHLSFIPGRTPEDDLSLQLVVKDVSGTEILFDVAGADSFAPVWSADSQSVVLISYDFFETLYVERFDVVNQTSEQLSTNTEFDFEQLIGILEPDNPIWSPNREWAIIFQTAQILDVDTGELFDYSGIPYQSPPVLWSSNSEFFLYVGGEQENFGIYRYDLPTQSTVLLVELDASVPIQDLIWWQGDTNTQ